MNDLDSICDNIKKEYSQKYICELTENYAKGFYIKKHGELHLDSEFAYKDKSNKTDIRIDIVKLENGVITFVVSMR